MGVWGPWRKHGLDLPLAFALQVQPSVGETLEDEMGAEEGCAFSGLGCNASTLTLRTSLSGGWCRGQVDRARKEVGDGGEAAPAPKSQSHLGTSVRATLHIWVPASGP